MTKRQTRWAAQHDWFISCSEIDGVWRVVARDDMHANAAITFVNFDELYEWAGY